MRKYFCAICIIAFATCCSKKNNIDKASSDVAILTSFAERPLTKTTINGNEVSGFTSTWSYTDAIGVYTTEGTSNALHSISIQPDGSAVFRGAIKASAVEQTLYSYYPHCTDATSNASAVFFNLPNEQKMEGDSYDHTAALMIGKPQTAIISGETGEIGNWQFAHINAYIRVNVANITVEGVSQNEKVSSVEIRSVGKALSGSMKINLTNASAKITGPSDYVRVFLTEGKTLSTFEAWAVVAPFSLNNEDFTVILNTENHSIYKTVKLSKNFQAGNIYTIGINIDENCGIAGTLDFAKAYTTSERKCYWRGGSANSKTYLVNASVDWKVSISDPEEATVTKNADGKSFTVVFPRSKWPVSKKYTVSIEPATQISGVSAKTMDLFLSSSSYKLSGDESLYESHDDGSVRLILNSKNNLWLKTSEAFKYGNYVWTFEDVSLSSGIFSLNNWQNNFYLMLQYGHDTALLASGGETRDVNNHKVGFGFDGGWDNVWNDTKKFTAGTFPTDYTQLKTIRLLIKPTKRTGTNQNLTLSRKVWINGKLVLDNSANVGDIWAANPSIPGFIYQYGIQNAIGSLVIKSFEIDENYSNYTD